MAASESETDTTIHTEPSAGDAYREAYEPFRVGGDKTEVHLFRQWWLNNPINNLWGSKKPNQWNTFKKVQAGATPEEAVKGGANVRLEDITHRGPTMEEVLATGEFEIHNLPSDEAWCGTPDPSIYAPGTNHLTKAQLEEEVSKGNVVTLRQLKQHLATASEADLEVWRKVMMMQRLKEERFIELPDGEGRVSVWDLWNYVKNNPELKALADKDPNLVVPAGGMSREERIRALAEAAPWKLCANERQMVLPPEVSDRLAWGLLAAGSWFSRRPTRWLKGLDGVKDFDYGLYVHEEAAQHTMQGSWAGKAPSAVVGDKAFYREALGLAPAMGMTLLAVASRPLPLEELTQSWQQRLQQQIDRVHPSASASSSSSSSSRPSVLLSTSSSAVTGSASGSGSESASGSYSEEESSSSEAALHSKSAAAALPAAPAVVQPAASTQQQQQQQQQQATAVPQLPAAPVAGSNRTAVESPPAAVAQQQRLQQQPQQAMQQPPATPAPAPAVAPVRDIAPQYQGLAQLVSLFEPSRLGSQTQLLDMRGTKLREGSTIIFTAHPSGALMIQAISPGLVKEQQSYVLGSVYDSKLTHALMSMFLDPDYSIDPDFTAAAGVRLLGIVNGQRLGQLQQSSSASPLTGADAEEASRQLLKRGKWGLPDVGKAPQQLPLVKGVRREVMYQQIEHAFESAMRAAAAVSPPEGQDVQDTDVQRSVAWARRHAAEAELKKQLSDLGLDVSSLSLAANDAAAAQNTADLLSLARPLAADAAVALGARH